MADEERNRRNYYRVLHVQPDAPLEVIRTAYRTLMLSLKMHPDLGGDPNHAALINEAFATLNNPQRRAAYDKLLNLLRDHQRSQAEARPVQALFPALQGKPPDQMTDTNRRCAFCGKSHSARSVELPDATCEGCQSPLFQAARHEHLTATRRALERVPRHMAVTCAEAGRPNVVFEMTTEDISINGMRLISRHELMPGQRLKIQCSFCDAVGLVTRVTMESLGWMPRWRAGVRFLTLQIKQIRGAFLSLEG